MFDVYGNFISPEYKSYTIVMTQECPIGETTTVDIRGLIKGSLLIRGGGSYNSYKITDKNEAVLLKTIDYGQSYIYPLYEGEAAFVEVTPNANATVIWKVEAFGNEPDEFRYGRTLVWNDEFNGNTLDLSKWYEEKAYNRRGSERGDGTNAFVQNNKLHLRILREHQYLENHTERAFSGEVLHSLFQYHYGLIEAKIKFASQGGWMSFWTLGANLNEYPKEGYNEGILWTTCGELDVVECNGSGRIYGNVHYDAGLGNEDDAVQIYGTVPNPNDLSSAFHVFGLEWTPETITWYVDYHRMGSINVDEYKTNADYNAFRLPHHILFSLQPVLPASYNQYTPPDDCNKLEGEIEWVRCYAPVGWENKEPISLLIDGNDGSEIITMTVGDEHAWDVTISPDMVVNKTTVWKSSMPNVASVCNNGGYVKCLSAGWTTITATMWNGVQCSIVIHVVENS